MLQFLKNLLSAIYNATVAGAVRLVRNTQQAKVDGHDKQYLGRVIIYVGFAVFACFFPQLATLIALLRVLVVVDVIGMIASIFQHTANAYA
jgi:hypothetical protein